ncbi:ABC transporter permease [Lysobacter sp. CFH 32150]|uniref:ABC transporter permease n=1 Tax=Lysobacter sp. CFH 32150 TaxID=2927128 RepID=UPI001FA79492|nr:ABC transporter permease [Lysobacter sp. CFH 32150]MCI4566877.1 ABC transporter permease [Lysobacter sp. CFH 32150]
MNVLLRALSAESLKLRGTLALWMCLVTPLTVVVLYVLQLTFTDYGKRPPLPPAEAWMMFAQSVLALWTLLMLPLFVTLESALVAGLEHGNQQWKHLMALPVPRSVHYLAKLVAVIAMVALAMGLLCLLIPLGGWVLGHLQPRFGIGGAPPWSFLLPRIAMIFATALLMIALQTWVAIRWHSFTIAVATGMTATVMGFLIGQSARFGPYYPWTMPVQVLAREGQHVDFVLVAGTCGCLVVTAFALWDFLRRETV